MLRIYDQRNDLPVWELASCETECMIGYHSVSAIADAYLKGYNDFDTTKALDAMVHTSKLDEYAKKEFAIQGFISSDQEAESVSKTLEYAYDDFCIAQMAESCSGDNLKSPDASSSRLTTSPFFRPFELTQSFGRETIIVDPPVTCSLRNSLVVSTQEPPLSFIRRQSRIHRGRQ